MTWIDQPYFKDLRLPWLLTSHWGPILQVGVQGESAQWEPGDHWDPFCRITPNGTSMVHPIDSTRGECKKSMALFPYPGKNRTTLNDTKKSNCSRIYWDIIQMLHPWDIKLGYPHLLQATSSDLRSHWRHVPTKTGAPLPPLPGRKNPTR